MDHDQQTWTTGISAKREYMQYSYIVVGDVITVWSLDFNEYSHFSLQRGCRHEMDYLSESGWHSMPYRSDVIDVVRARDFGKCSYLYF